MIKSRRQPHPWFSPPQDEDLFLLTRIYSWLPAHTVLTHIPYPDNSINLWYTYFLPPLKPQKRRALSSWFDRHLQASSRSENRTRQRMGVTVSWTDVQTQCSWGFACRFSNSWWRKVASFLKPGFSSGRMKDVVNGRQNHTVASGLWPTVWYNIPRSRNLQQSHPPKNHHSMTQKKKTSEQTK